MVSRRKKTQKVNRSGANQRVTRNPADVRAGIDAGRIGKNSEAQRTQSRAEAEQEKKRPGSTMQDRIRATNRADPSSKGDTQRRVDARNIRRGFPTGETPLRPTVGTPRDTASIPEESQPFRGTAFDSE